MKLILKIEFDRCGTGIANDMETDLSEKIVADVQKLCAYDFGLTIKRKQIRQKVSANFVQWSTEFFSIGQRRLLPFSGKAPFFIFGERI